MNKHRIAENLEMAIQAVENHSDQFFDLSQYVNRREDCGTLYCTAGLLTTIPAFIEQGMTYNGSSVMIQEGHKRSYLSDSAGNRMFGKDSFRRLFEPYSDGVWDRDLSSKAQKILTHKELALARLNKQLTLINTSIAKEQFKKEQ